MHKSKKIILIFTLIGILGLSVFFFSDEWRWIARKFDITRVFAIGQYVPTGGALPVGTETAITSGATTGNVGSWKGTLASEGSVPGFNWTVNSDATNGLNQQLFLDGVELNGANKFIIQINANAGASTLNRLYQICDWITTSAVDNDPDAVCTGGGWRTLNKTNGTARTPITETSQRTYIWHIYDGYWTTSVTTSTSVSTPLSNFIRSSDKRVLLRAFSTSKVTTTHLINSANLTAVVDPIYFPAGFTQISGGTVTTGYTAVENPPTLISGSGASGSDNVWLTVSSTASVIADFYLSFRNIKTYQGMNAILVRAEYSCSATGITHKPKIWNFLNSQWEDLTSTGISCSTTDAANQFAKNNVTIGNYVENGEARIGWYGSATSTAALRLDYIYIIVGSTNADAAQSEVSFGSAAGGTTAAATRDIDTTLTANTWQIATELESTDFGHPYYAYDNDADATSTESAAAANLSFPVAVPQNAAVTALVYAMNWRSNSTAITTTGQFKDLGANLSVGGFSNIWGGWQSFGTTNVALTYTYQDPISQGYYIWNPDDFVDTVDNLMNVRIRTSASVTSTAATFDIDFVFVSIQWVESQPSNSPPNAPSQDEPVNNATSTSVYPVFKMTATDTDNDYLQYKVTIYSNSGCTTVVQTNDQSASQTGWSGQNASSSQAYTSGTQGTFTTQSGLNASTTHWWKAGAKDPDGSNTWTDSSTCNSFTTGNPELRQIHYHWRNDNGTETTATAAANEDAPLLNVGTGTIKRLRIEISNKGVATSSAVTCQIEFATSTGGPWTAVPTSTAQAWQIADSANLTDGAATTNIATSTGGTTDDNPTFVAGQVKDTANLTSGITLDTTEFTEHEWSLRATANATSSFIYYFRATNAGDTTNFTYIIYPSSTVAGPANAPPNAPSLDSPANGVQNISTTPTFKTTATDPESDKLQYKATLYSNSGCTTLIATYDQSVSQTGWTGQNTTCFSGSDCYTSGTQGAHTVQSALSISTTYWWKASAKDPLGSDTWTNSASCNGFTTTSGLWTTDSGSWSINGNALVVTPPSASTTQIHVTGESQTNGMIEAKIARTSGSSGDASLAMRADTGSNRYQFGNLDFAGQRHRIGKMISSSYSTITSSTKTLSTGIFYQVRGYLTGTSLQSWIDGGTALSGTDSSLSGAGFVGLTAYNSNTFTFDNFAFYTSPTVTLNNLPGGGSWSIQSSTGTVLSCRTGSTWDLSAYGGQVPIDYDNGGGKVGVWANSSCSGGPAVTYPPSGLAADIFGGDTYSYSGGGQATTVVRASSTITISKNGLISF